MPDFVTYQCPTEGCRAVWSGALGVPDKCPRCGSTGVEVSPFAEEPQSPPPFTPTLRPFKEIPLPATLTPVPPAEAVTITPAPAPSFKVPFALKALAAVLVPLLAVAAVFVPFPFGPLCAVLALVAAGFLGISIPLPKFLAGRALVGPTLAPLFATLATALGKLAFMQPEGTRAFYLLYAAAGTCALLAGVAVPLKS